MRAYVICRDRVTYARKCITALAKAELEVCVADHGSTWPPMLEWLDRWESNGMRVFRCGDRHPRNLWEYSEFIELTSDGEPYVVSDCDVVPADDCPVDWPAYLLGLLDEYDAPVKVGLGLRTDNLPDHYRWRAEVARWESQFSKKELRPGVYDALLDTTLAVYRPMDRVFGFALGPAIRTGAPYLAEHLPWREDVGNLSEELRYYHRHALKGVTFWHPDEPASLGVGLE